MEINSKASESRMKMSLKNRMKKRDLTIGSWITIGSTVVAEIMSQSGFDWLTIDMEHSAITLDIAQDLIRVVELSNVTPLVRVGHNQSNLIKRVMDAGSKGVIVPMVNTRADAEKAVGAVKYPPSGFRGVGLARAQKYGSDFEGYKDWNEDGSIVIVQIEHIKAVENIEDILTVPGVDGFIVGPYDLSGSLGLPGQFDHQEVIAALSEIERTAKNIKALSGFHVIPTQSEEVEKKVRQGYRFIAHSLDILFLGDGCKSAVNNNHKIMLK